MAAPINPGVTAVNGRRKVIFVPANGIADVDNPTAGELAGGLDLSFFAMSDQAMPTAQTNKVTLPRVLGEVQAYEMNGTAQWAHPDLVCVVDPQAADSTDKVKAWEDLDDNVDGFIVWGINLDADDEIDAGDKVSVYPCNLGVKYETTSSTDESAISQFVMPVAVTAAPAKRVEVAAGS